MQTAPSNLFTRDDTFLGICEALGQDLGFDPLWLRMAIPVLLFMAPVATIAGYFGAGAVVLLSRLIFPDPRLAAPVEHAMPVAENAQEPEPMPLAA